MTQLQTTESITAIVDDLLVHAKDQIMSENNDVMEGGPELEAMLVHRALMISEMQRQKLRIAQGHLVSLVARNKLHHVYPGITGRTDKHKMRHFLRSIKGPTGEQMLSESAVSTLTGFGSDVLPFCDEKKVEIDHVVSGHWPKLVDCVPALRNAVKNDDAESVQKILSDVESATTRAAVRSKYQTHRDGSIGVGAILPMGGTSKVAVVLLLDDTDAIGDVARALGARIKWAAIATAQLESGHVNITMEDKDDSS
jgi:hypothetical protein